MYCLKPQQSRFTLKSTQGEYNFTPGDKDCSTGIDSKLDIDRDTEDVVSSPGGKSCSTGISGNLDDTRVLEDELQIGDRNSLPIGTRVCHKKSPGQVGTVIKAIDNSTRYSIAWDVGGKSTVFFLNDRNLDFRLKNPVASLVLPSSLATDDTTKLELLLEIIEHI